MRDWKEPALTCCRVRHRIRESEITERWEMGHVERLRETNLITRKNIFKLPSQISLKKDMLHVR